MGVGCFDRRYNSLVSQIQQGNLKEEVIAVISSMTILILVIFKELFILKKTWHILFWNIIISLSSKQYICHRQYLATHIPSSQSHLS